MRSCWQDSRRAAHDSQRDFGSYHSSSVALTIVSPSARIALHTKPSSTSLRGRSYYILAFFRTLWDAGKDNTVRFGAVSGARGVITFARSFGSLPPNMRAMLNSERLPHIRHRSCGLSLTTSHSAHRTAFCRATAFRNRPTSEGPSTNEFFITEPRRRLRIFNSHRVGLLPPRLGHPTRHKRHSLSKGLTTCWGSDPGESTVFITIIALTTASCFRDDRFLPANR